MPILATGNSDCRAGEAGFSLIELLTVLAILSLMVGMVVLNLPQPRSEVDRASEAMTAQLTRFLGDGALSGEIRAFGASETDLTLYRHDGMTWAEVATLPWPDDARVSLRIGEEAVELTEETAPALLFEPYGQVPDFTLEFQSQEADYVLSADTRGQIVRTVER